MNLCLSDWVIQLPLWFLTCKLKRAGGEEDDEGVSLLDIIQDAYHTILEKEHFVRDSAPEQDAAVDPDIDETSDVFNLAQSPETFCNDMQIITTPPKSKSSSLNANTASPADSTNSSSPSTTSAIVPPPRKKLARKSDGAQSLSASEKSGVESDAEVEPNQMNPLPDLHSHAIKGEDESYQFVEALSEDVKCHPIFKFTEKNNILSRGYGSNLAGLTSTFSMRYITSWLGLETTTDNLTIPGSDVTESQLIDKNASAELLKDSDIVDFTEIEFFTINDLIISVVAKFNNRKNKKLWQRSRINAQKQIKVDDLLLGNVTVYWLVRDIAGKQCWSSAPVFGLKNVLENIRYRLADASEVNRPLYAIAKRNREVHQQRKKTMKKYFDAKARPKGVFPKPQDQYQGEEYDAFADLVEYTRYKMPELNNLYERTVSGASEAERPLEIAESLEDDVVEMLNKQEEHVKKMVDEQQEQAIDAAVRYRYVPLSYKWPKSAWAYASMLLSEIGHTSYRKRASFFPLKKSVEMLRDMRLLDRRGFRDYHKIGIIYVGRGQEDKASIMRNKGASKLFLWFINKLGWTVDLNTHDGWMGGFARNLKNQETWRSIYYASPTVEVMTHISVMIPLGGSDESDYTSRVRHIGNDAVIIVWSEHWHDYNSSIIRTDFADVIICIYPIVESGLFRIEIIKKSSAIADFGPLRSGTLIDSVSLPSMVRATAINASRALRYAMPQWEWFFEERARYLSTLINKHSEVTSYQSFIEKILRPALKDVECSDDTDIEEFFRKVDIRKTINTENLEEDMQHWPNLPWFTDIHVGESDDEEEIPSVDSYSILESRNNEKFENFSHSKNFISESSGGEIDCEDNSSAEGPGDSSDVITSASFALPVVEDEK